MKSATEPRSIRGKTRARERQNDNTSRSTAADELANPELSTLINPE
jgi:hypothetical protein